MIKLGLIGKDIKHSKSKVVYEDILKKEIDYKLYDIKEKENLPSLELLFKENQGISITAPYKKDFTNSVKIQGDVSELGIINCIRKNDNSFEATNTDFLAVLDFLKRQTSNKKLDIILLGDGSMAEITIFALNLLKKKFTQLSRKLTSDFSELDLTKISSSETLVINTCAREYTYSGPLDESILFWDHNYSHENHISRFENSSTQYVDGMELLRTQAQYALEFWGINY